MEERTRGRVRKEKEGRWSGGRPLLRRIVWYHEKLRSGGFTTAEASEAHDISERTLYRDMGYALTLGWDVEFCRSRRRWVLASGDAALPLLTLPEGEAVALLVAEEALRSFAGTPYAELLHRALEKIAGILDEPVSLDLEHAPLPRFTGPPARRVEPAQYLRLVEACRKRDRLEIVYQSPERDEVTTRAIEPYRMFYHAGDWYVAAYDHLRGMVRTFALGERIREVRETGERFEADPEWSFDQYMAQGFGLFQSGPVEEVALRFSRAVAPYLREKAWDETESKEELPDGGLVLRMRVPVNVGLLRFVLQYGAEVTVLEPERLRAQVRDEAERTAGSYSLQRG